MGDSVRLGPFELGEHLGEGGMGVVYRARHVETDATVAVKALLSAESRRPKKRRGFRREIQALAKLHHPAIAAIADFGEIGTAAERNGPQSFAEGAPWFAMEYVDGPSLNHVARSWSWSELAEVLHRILDGLAHAHARSIIHRDLKPSNILIEESPEGRPLATLVDFGVARLFELEDEQTAVAREEADRVSGTPQFMAPEHIFGEWRDQGPWTDLYALGCMTWRIVCDRAPFVGDTTDEILRKHVHEPLPSFEPRIAVPDGLEKWLRGLMHKDPERRTRRAADAAWRLSKLSAPPESTASGETPEGAIEASPPTLHELHDTYLETVETAAETVRDTALDPSPPEGDRDAAIAPVTGGGPRSGQEAPPVSTDWRRHRRDRSAEPLPKTGLNLFGLREVPLVDRDDERDRLWDQLREVEREQHPRLVTIEAGPGTGKTRLARWLHHRAHELGAATLLRAVHTPEGGRNEGLREMIRHAFHTEGFDRSEVFEHLAERLPALEEADSRLIDARALTELLHPTDDDADAVDGPRYQFSSPKQKHALVRRFFARLAVRRPLAVWLDDLQWGREAIGVLRDLFDAPEFRHPILVVATLRTDVVAEDPDLGERLEELYEKAETIRLQLSPLDADDHRRLVDRLLDLDPELAEELAARTEGNPLFAIQLLRDWVDRGHLEPGEGGFERVGGASIEVPDDIHELWLRRIDRSVRDLEEVEASAAWRAVEAAALLGREVDPVEWGGLCERFGVEDSAALRDALVGRGLAENTDTGWAFTHGMLTDSLARRAHDKERFREHHRHCARLLEELAADRAQGAALRRANHWIDAGEPERAVAPLLEEAERLRETGNAGPRRDMLERRAALLDDLEVPDDDPRRIENTVETGACRLQLGAPPEEVQDSLETARERAESTGGARLTSKAHGISARCRRALGEPERAATFAREAVRHARETDDTAMLAEMLIEEGWTAYLSGDLERAEARYSEALEHADDAGARYFEAVAHLGMAWIIHSRGDDVRAGELLERLLEESREVGYRALEAECRNGLGEIARFEGDAERARRCYREHREISRELDRPEFVAVSQLNLALVDVMDGRFESAADGLDAIARHEEDSEKAERTHLIRAARLTRAAGVEAWEEFDRHFEPYDEGWPDEARLVKDHPWLLEIAGEYAAEAGEAERSREARRLAAELWRDLGNEERAERAESTARESEPE